MAEILIDGTTFIVPIMNFDAVEQAWPVIQSFADTYNAGNAGMVLTLEYSVTLLSIALHETNPELTPQKLKSLYRGADGINLIQRQIELILSEAGLFRPGELLPAKDAANPSMAISEQSTPN